MSTPLEADHKMAETNVTHHSYHNHCSNTITANGYLDI